MTDALISLYASHGLLQHILAVLDDIWHAVVSNGDFAAIYPLAQDTSCPFILAGLVAQCVELLLEVLDLLTLLFHLAVILVVHGVHDLLHLELVTHHRLSALSLASCLEDMHTPAFSCYEYERDTSVRKGRYTNESCTYC